MASYWAFTSSTMPLRSMRQRLSRPTVTDTSFTWAVRSFSSWEEQKWEAQGCCRGLKVSLTHSPFAPSGGGDYATSCDFPGSQVALNALSGYWCSPSE